MKIELREIEYKDYASFLSNQTSSAPFDPLHEALPAASELHPQALLCGAFGNDVLIGVCCCQREDRPEENHLGIFRLRSLFVARDNRGQGVARLLILRCSAYTKRFNSHYIWCKADPSLTIFLRKCGFYVELPTTPPEDGLGVFIRDTATF